MVVQRRYFYYCVAALAFLSIVLFAGVTHSTITTYYGTGLVEADGVSNEAWPIAIPTYTTWDAINGDTHSKNVIDLSVNGGQTILKLDIDHKRTGATSSRAETYGGSLGFIANDNEPYEFAGFYNVTDVGSSGSVYMHAYLCEESPFSFVFSSKQYSENTTNEQFVLGGSGGDTLNNLEGSLTGNLIAGRAYFIGFDYAISAYPDADSGGTALGSLIIKIGVVPEPSGLSLCLAGAFALQLRRKR